MTMDVMLRNPENGRFEPVSAREVVNKYLEENYDTSLDELLRCKKQVTETVRGKLAFP